MSRLGRDTVRLLAVGVTVAVLVGAAVLLAAGLRDTTYEGRVALLAGPVTGQDPAVPTGGAQYGEVVSLTLPALAQFARSPSVLQAATAKVPGSPAPDEVAKAVSVELVPASGMARLSVHAPTEATATGLASAVATAMIDADLLAPVGRLRLLDERPEVALVQPDWLLATGLALAAAAAAGLAAAMAYRALRPGGSADERAVRDALAAAGLRRPVPVLHDDDPTVTERLGLLVEAAERPVRVLPLSGELAVRAKELSSEFEDQDTSAGTAVVVLTPAGRKQEALTAAAGVLPGDSILVAVVLA
ncbi:hypothetical protein [Amycolatopsis magusensis]|uniref:hypothetical protein n=1 Tax=Amycolatopsis magusensis TaxID=882444 RepID=UPI0037BE0BBC